ncbi:MAG: hypothetical protein A2289_22740 [Deltaproteobacteria bacterium RIFOXYA12_FULL_58_15]|nr:MAG: hypothetical protein A2289_22740 [Deltaproteobacteria bacterium RIFOXYA12_FULL_58_15]OGR12766.1 MAG: hypothetical protein A2341_21775 [Deltaproteobacteria bacterium RIFOXYB12_FULL_58_9]
MVSVVRGWASRGSSIGGSRQPIQLQHESPLVSGACHPNIILLGMSADLFRSNVTKLARTASMYSMGKDHV